MQQRRSLVASNIRTKNARPQKPLKLATKICLLLAALAVIAAACGRDDDDPVTGPDTTPTTATAPPQTTTTTGGEDPDGETTTTEAPLVIESTTTSPDICETAELEDSEIGITADKITILVMADVGSPLAPGLFQGSIDGTKAWADHVNENGGLACREIEVIEHDSQINPEKTTSGFLRACEEAVALIGSTSLFVTNVEDLNTCTDQAGNPIGIPDIPERAVEAVHACSPNTFAITNAICPYSGSGAREYHNMVGPHRWLQAQATANGNPLHGVFLIPGDLASAINSSMPGIRSNSEIGIGNDGEFNVSGAAPQASYAQYIEVMKSSDSNYAYTGSNDQSMLKWKSEAEVQGLDLDSITWICSIACYTPDFQEQDVAEGTYVWLSFLPFEEKDANDELNTFIGAMGEDNPPSWAAGAWVAGRLFENAVNQIVARDGLNAITRQAILDEMRQISAFDANGWFGTLNFSTKLTSPCFVLLRVTDGEFARVYPQERGTFDCNADNNILVNVLDSEAEYNAGPEGYLEERSGTYEVEE